MKYLDLDGLKHLKAKMDDRYLSTNNATKIRDKINLTTETKISLTTKYSLLSNNSVVFYVITDSSGKLPSSETRININSNITSLIGVEGANVGDMFIIGKLNSLPIYKIIPLNDAKSDTSDYKGTNGIMTPWDKARINKVDNIETTANNAANNLPTKGESNMNNALDTGVYPWCILGRPSGATGAFTCITKKSTTKDANGYWTIEQTAYGREAELGQVYKRVIFKQDNKDAEYTDWINVSSLGIIHSIKLKHVDVPSAECLIRTNGDGKLNVVSNGISLSTVVNNDESKAFESYVDTDGSIAIAVLRYKGLEYKFNFDKAIELGLLVTP